MPSGSPPLSRTILITGASGGLGAALARASAAPGVQLVLWGRDLARLDVTVQDCVARGAAVEAARHDLRDGGGMIEALRALDARQPLDIAIFNAGVGGMAPRHVAVEQAERALEVATVNFSSTIAGATAIAERMVGRRAGHIVLIGSVAEAFPLPMAPAYAGSKAGLRMFAEALELRIAPHDVKVTLVSPGFIDTAMSRGVEGPKPFMLTADTAAAAILRAVGRRSSRLTLPRRFAAVRIVAGLLPRALTRAVLRRL